MTPADIEEIFSALGPVSIRRMFGGKGVYFRGQIIAVEFRDSLLLKADEVSGPEFAAAGATRWAYEGRTGRAVNMPYWSIPESALDDPDAMAHWVRLAYEAALRSPTQRRSGVRRRRPRSSRETRSCEDRNSRLYACRGAQPDGSAPLSFVIAGGVGSGSRA